MLSEVQAARRTSWYLCPPQKEHAFPRTSRRIAPTLPACFCIIRSSSSELFSEPFVERSPGRMYQPCDQCTGRIGVCRESENTLEVGKGQTKGGYVYAEENKRAIRRLPIYNKSIRYICLLRYMQCIALHITKVENSAHFAWIFNLNHRGLHYKRSAKNQLVSEDRFPQEGSEISCR